MFTVAFIGPAQCGNSVLCVNFAYELTRQTGARVLLVDLAPTAQATWLLSKSYDHALTVANLFDHSARVDAVTQFAPQIGSAPSGLGRPRKFDPGRLHLAPADPSYDLEMQALFDDWPATCLRDLLADAPYDWILLACPDGYARIVSIGLAAASGYFLCIRATAREPYQGVGSFLRVEDLFHQRYNPSLTCYGSVLTDYHGKFSKALRARKTVPPELQVGSHTLLRNALHPDAFVAAADHKLVVELPEKPGAYIRPMSMASAALRALTKEMLARIRATTTESPGA